MHSSESEELVTASSNQSDSLLDKLEEVRTARSHGAETVSDGVHSSCDVSTLFPFFTCTEPSISHLETAVARSKINITEVRWKRYTEKMKEFKHLLSSRRVVWNRFHNVQEVVVIML
ncbi:hypothetical protein AB6A40_010554 [Gnathostoma spinigerum]|uniref:Uncharacterized protein n=1 Tax=Gnathostoma spinigerum TaxID=75299 RepID=A0ABD6EWH6_9BILA